MDNDAIEINRLHKQNEENSIRIGELLFKKKQKLNHGEWIPWIENNLEFGRMQANHYIRCYKTKCKTGFTFNTKTIQARNKKTESVNTSLSDRPPEPSEDEKKFQEVRKVQNRAPLGSDYYERTKKAMEAHWKWMNEYDALSYSQLEEITQMCVDFWTEKRNGLVKKRFRAASDLTRIKNS